jgi:NAD(P)-dependent dehydrogenase (short-subunit alcohol dehydrogenase family)
MNQSSSERGVAAIAGIAPGLGLAVAAAFADAGYGVAGLSRAPVPGDGPYRHYTADLTRPEEVGTALAHIARELGPITVLIYNPMQLIIKPFLELTEHEFESVWRTTCFGAMVIVKAVLPGMLRSGGGTIILTGATASIKGGASWASLASAKFGLRGLAQSLVREFGPQGVHVAHVVIDGLIWSPQTRSRFTGVTRERCIDPEAIAATYLDLTRQARCAWSHEIDLRPGAEKF